MAEGVNLCKTCIYGQYIEGVYVHRDGLSDVIKEGREDWESWKGEEPSIGNPKEIEMTISYCYFPDKIEDIVDTDKNKEFHDMSISICNRYEQFVV